ncbi:cold shock protein [uncultured Gammaproteobacteria bacterium]
MSFDDGVQARALVKWFNVAKGFGFVAPVDGSPDAFLHISVLNRAGLQAVSDGAEILCHLAPGPKGPQVTRLVEVLGEGPSVAAGNGGRLGGSAGPGQNGMATQAAGRATQAAGTATQIEGTVKWFKPDKGFGFVAADDSGKDVFVHKSVLHRCGLTQLDSGQRVRMQVQEGSKGREAVWIKPSDGGAFED